MTAGSTCRSLLLAELTRRKERNGAYSLRSFARDLGLSAASVSNVLAGKQGLSVVAARKISEALGWDSLTKSCFESMRLAEFGRTARERQKAARVVRRLGRVRDLNLANFRAHASAETPDQGRLLRSGR